MDYVGKDVSIKCKKDIGTFQGKIEKAEVHQLTIKNAFLNGVKLKKSDYHVTISCDEIESISFIQVVDPSSIQNNNNNTNHTRDATQNTVIKQTDKKSPPNLTGSKANQNDVFRQPKTTRPIAVRKNVQSAPEVAVSQNKRFSKKRNKNYDLLQPEDFSDQGDFDFESNNAMFDKQSVFQEIEEQIYGKNPTEKPDLVRQIGKTEEKYRHDENVLDSMLMQFRNIQLEFKPKQEYTTDEACIVIPSIPKSLRNRIQNLAADAGYSFERQNDFLARGGTELALQLLGGSRRLSPKNLHQWPRVTIICDEPYNCRQSEIGLSTGRQLASHGVNVMVYVKTSTSHSDKPSKELELYSATGNDFTGNVKDLLPCDLVIMSVTNMNQNSQIIRYIQENRAPIMAIDPPVTGINPGEIVIKNAVIPILPLDDIQHNFGKVHLVNIGLSAKFFKDAGIKYFPVFGSKFMIPLHLKS